MPDILSIYRQYGVRFATEGDRHTTQGWVNTTCPFCNKGGQLHLGYNLQTQYFRCWVCGWIESIRALAALCNVSKREAIELYQSISRRPGAGNALKRDKAMQARINLHPYRRPSDWGKLRSGHRRYLEGRKFDPDLIVQRWGIVGTGPAAFLDDLDYRHRLLIPIRWQGREVSFQTRDVTDRAELKYKACPMEREVITHKHIVYGHPNAFQARTGIAVEGVTDCWRLQDAAFCLFGIQYKVEQLHAIREHFDRVAIVFDAEPQAQQQARKLRGQLAAVGLHTTLIKISSGDPGEMSDDDADHLIRDVRRWGNQIPIAG